MSNRSSQPNEFTAPQASLTESVKEKACEMTRSARENTTELLEVARDGANEAMKMARNKMEQFRPALERGLPSYRRQNVAQPERIGSLIAGALMTVYGIRKGGTGGGLAALAGSSLLLRGVTGHCGVYQSLGINTAGPQTSGASLVGNDGVCVEKSILIKKSPEELYRFWRSFENLPRFMHHLESVSIIDGKHSHWVAKAPAGMKVEWDAEIINERENELIAWRSMPHSEIPNAGSVRFTPDDLGRGTWIKVSLNYQPPAGKVGAAIAKLFGEEPAQQIEDDLENFKRIMESETSSTLDSQSNGSQSL